MALSLGALSCGALGDDGVIDMEHDPCRGSRVVVHGVVLHRLILCLLVAFSVTLRGDPQGFALDMDGVDDRVLIELGEARPRSDLSVDPCRSQSGDLERSDPALAVRHSEGR